MEHGTEKSINYLRWLAERGINFPAISAALHVKDSEPFLDGAKYLFLVSSFDSKKSSPELSLLEKIIQAIKIDSKQVYIANIDNSQTLSLLEKLEEKSALEFVFLCGERALKTFFKDDDFNSKIGEIEMLPRCNVPYIGIHDIGAMIDKPELKRPTWVGLQKVVKYLNLI